MLQVVRRLHFGTTSLVGIMCGNLCDEVNLLASFFDVAFISAGGCIAMVDTAVVDKYRPTTLLRVVPGHIELGRVYAAVVQHFK